MAFIILNNQKKEKPILKILLFTEGTTLGPKVWYEWFFVARYVPIKNAVEKLLRWEDQGAIINYITSRTAYKDVEKIRNLLLSYNFPGCKLYYRDKGEKYSNIVETELPNVLIEDNCKSIGGKWQMAITYVRQDIRERIKSIVVSEFKGIDNLPDSIYNL